MTPWSQQGEQQATPRVWTQHGPKPHPQRLIQGPQGPHLGPWHPTQQLCTTILNLHKLITIGLQKEMGDTVKSLI